MQETIFKLLLTTDDAVNTVALPIEEIYYR